MANNKCDICEEKIPDGTKVVCCDSCHVIMHPVEACTGLNASELRAAVIQKRTLMFFCKTCREAFRAAPALVRQIKDLKEEIEGIKRELEGVKMQKCTHGETEVDTKQIFTEFQERANKSKNFIIFNAKESQSDELSVRIEDDKKVVQEVCRLLDVQQSVNGAEVIDKVLRLGTKKEGYNRPLKVVCTDPSFVKRVVKAKRKLLESAYIR
ncbi:unnamed protein product [Ceutorhynchus assimilis]|uniref:Uncharacterized protein n=1 Tax=Ceutorhynchus assimilis TaxID=467358 RepID=A0A9N9MIJ4_9CUCU|nr:unnamed protein product [Ceutorhynchus assimilis]